MADTQHLTENRLRQHVRHRQRVVFRIGVLIVLLLIWVNLYVGLAALVATLFMVLSTGTTLRSGAEGEEAIEDLLRELPDGYVLFNQLHIPNSRNPSRPFELDYVVVAPGGIVLIEVKNNRGLVRGVDEEYEWEVQKTSHQGNVYYQRMRNPVRQVKVQASALKAFFKTRSLKVWVEPVVVFSHPEARLNIGGGGDVPVVKPLKLLGILLKKNTSKFKKHDAIVSILGARAPETLPKDKYYNLLETDISALWERSVNLIKRIRNKTTPIC